MEAVDKAREKKLELVRAYKTVFKSLDGKIVLQDMMKQCNFTDATYSHGVNDLSMQIKEGRRSVVLDILKILETSEEEILNIINGRNFEEEEEIL